MAMVEQQIQTQETNQITASVKKSCHFVNLVKKL